MSMSYLEMCYREKKFYDFIFNPDDDDIFLNRPKCKYCDGVKRGTFYVVRNNVSESIVDPPRIAIKITLLDNCLMEENEVDLTVTENTWDRARDGEISIKESPVKCIKCGKDREEFESTKLCHNCKYSGNTKKEIERFYSKADPLPEGIFEEKTIDNYEWKPFFPDKADK